RRLVEVGVKRVEHADVVGVGGADVLVVDGVGDGLAGLSVAVAEDIRGRIRSLEIRIERRPQERTGTRVGTEGEGVATGRRERLVEDHAAAGTTAGAGSAEARRRGDRRATEGRCRARRVVAADEAVAVVV